jgi:hypothetical protein
VAAAACLLFILGGSLAAQDKQYRPPPRYVQFGEPDQAEGRRILEDFRQRGIPGDYYLQFNLRVMPRRGAERTISGELWGSRNERGPISRVALARGSDDERRLLVQNGPQNAVWSWRGGEDAAVAALDPRALFDPLGDSDVTAFDMQMPFLYWTDFVFEGVARVRGRPAHVFLMYPSDAIAAQKPALVGVRVFLDTQFNALVQAEQIGPGDRAVKSITVLDLKKIDEQWIVKSIDIRDEETRNKTRFQVTGAALGLDLAPALFEPAMLQKDVPPPVTGRIRKVAP